MSKHRFTVQYGPHGIGHCVLDTERGRNVFFSLAKSEVIGKAQELNGFEQVDGDERTYSRQIEEYQR